jgi:signal transduction histidine kinase
LTSARVPATTARRSLQDLIPAAVDHAAEELGRRERIAAQEIRERLGVIVHLVLGAPASNGSNGRVGRHVGLDAMATVPAHYVDTLRSALLAEILHSRVTVDSRELVELLSALETAQTRQAGDPHHDFTRHLASADAVNAVVEIAHDMRSPLTSILFLVDTLRRGQSGPVTVIQERQLGLIYGAALGLNTLASDVIDAVRGGQRLVDGPPIPFSIAEVILNVCDTVRPVSEEKGLPVQHVLPMRDGRRGYPAALGRVLLNLVTNALKYTNQGSVTVGCTELGATAVSFFVQDTGEGIPPHVMSMLFDGFRPSASGMRFSNAGLGLAICESFLRAMGTSLEVQSARETGTRFSFTVDLPRA